MRGWLSHCLAAIMLSATLSACRERDFDDRFSDAERAMRATAGAIDAEIAARASEAAIPAAPASLPGEPDRRTPQP